MASLDYVFDLASKLSKDNMSYFIVTLQRGTGDTDKADLFFDMSDEQSLRSMQAVLGTVTEEMEESDDLEHFYRKKKRNQIASEGEDEDDETEFLF
jgi:hypothetical protein